MMETVGVCTASALAHVIHDVALNMTVIIREFYVLFFFFTEGIWAQEG